MNLQLKDNYDKAKKEYSDSKNFVRAYYYYKIFILKIIPEIIKYYSSNLDGLSDENCLVNFDIKVINTEAQLKKLTIDFDFKKVTFAFKLGDNVYDEFLSYLERFLADYSIYAGLIGNITGEEKETKLYLLGNLKNLKNAFYSELQRFQYSDELIDSIQAEENTNVNGEKLTKNIMKR